MKNRQNLLIIAGLALLLFLAVVVAPHFTGPKEPDKGVGDLALARGKIISYSFLDDSRGTHQYIIRLSGYPASFQIPGDFAQYFAKARFESDLKKGDSLSVSIPAASAAKLISNGPISVFAIRTTTATYLDDYYTVRDYNNRNKAANESPALGSVMVFPLVVSGSIIVLAGLGGAIWKISRVIAARPPKIKYMSDPEALYESSQRLKQCAAKVPSEEKSLPAGESEENKSTLPNTNPC